MIRSEDNRTGPPTVTRSLDWSGVITVSELWKPSGGKRIHLEGWNVNTSAACTVTMFYGSTNDLGHRIFKGFYAADSGQGHLYTGKPLILPCDTEIRITTSATGGAITIYGYEA